MNFEGIKKIAYYKATAKEVNNSEIDDFLKTWWSDKYNRPTNDPLLLDRTTEELLLEYYYDTFKNNKDERLLFEKQSKVETEDDDEKWFKKMMGDQYTKDNAYSGEMKEKINKSKKNEDDFEDNFTLG